MNLKSWLRRTPQPASLVCDGKKVAVGEGSRKWVDLVDTIVSLGTTRLEAVAPDGTILRVVELAGGEIDQEEKQTPAAANLTALSKMSELAQLAQIIGDVGDRSAARHEAAYKLAFEEFGKINSAILDRLTAMEQSWIMSLNTIAELKMQVADVVADARSESEGNGGLVTSLLGAAMGGMGETPGAGAKPNGKANGKTNGHGKKPS